MKNKPTILQLLEVKIDEQGFKHYGVKGMKWGHKTGRVTNEAKMWKKIAKIADKKGVDAAEKYLAKKNIVIKKAEPQKKVSNDSENESLNRSKQILNAQTSKLSNETDKKYGTDNNATKERDRMNKSEENFLSKQIDYLNRKEADVNERKRLTNLAKAQKAYSEYSNEAQRRRDLDPSWDDNDFNPKLNADVYHTYVDEQGFKHYGVKGMKWGVTKAAKTAAKLGSLKGRITPKKPVSATIPTEAGTTSKSQHTKPKYYTKSPSNIAKNAPQYTTAELKDAVDRFRQVDSLNRISEDRKKEPLRKLGTVLSYASLATTVAVKGYPLLKDKANESKEKKAAKTKNIGIVHDIVTNLAKAAK